MASTRQGRVGQPVTEWFAEKAAAHKGFVADVIDLKEVNLPLLDEPNHPRLQKYEREYTKAWSARVQALDAFVFVTPEYNYGTSPALLNALDYLYAEWNYKPCAFVSYGGVSGGTRSVVMARQVVSTLKMVPLVESVTIPFVAKLIQNGRFAAGETHDKAASALLDELARWERALRVLR
jgi:NAD(P)H-dependent FMN reductase